MSTPDQLSDQLSDQDQPKRDPAQDPRMLAMNAIKVERDEEEPTETPAPVAKTNEQLEAQLAVQPELITDGLDKKLVRVKVDGEEQEVSLDLVVRNFQKTAAADKRLADASRLLDQAKAAKPPAPVAPANDGSDTAGTDGAVAAGDGQPSPKAKKFIAALFEGDEDAAAQALEEVIAGRAPGSTQVDPTAIAAQVTPAIKAQLENDSALERFLEANQDIVKDPHLTNMVNGFLDEELAGGKPYADALDSAGARVKDWLTTIGAGKPAEPAPTTPNREDKLARKAQMDNISAAHIAASSTQPPPQTASDVINEMRKARGLMV